MLRYFLQRRLHCRETAVNMSKYFLKMTNILHYTHIAEVEIHLCLKDYYATLRLHAGIDLFALCFYLSAHFSKSTKFCVEIQ